MPINQRVVPGFEPRDERLIGKLGLKESISSVETVYLDKDVIKPIQILVPSPRQDEKALILLVDIEGDDLLFDQTLLVNDRILVVGEEHLDLPDVLLDQDLVLVDVFHKVELRIVLEVQVRR